MKVKPDSDMYPPYNDDYFNDMREWRLQTGCAYPDCGCAKLLVKGTCQHDFNAILDYSRKYPELFF